MSQSSISQFTSLALKTVGVIIVVSSLLDYITLAISVDFLDSQSQIGFISQLVDRGIVPMVGISFLLVGYWIDLNFGNAAQPKGFDLRLPMFILSLVLGFVFLISVPLHLNNLRLVSSDALSQLEARATEAENRIQDQYEQLEAISEDPQRLQVVDTRIQEIDTALGSGQFQGQNLNPQQLERLQNTKIQLENFRELAKNPEALEARLNELQNQLRDQKQQREGRARTETLKQGVRTGLSSLMLAIGYIFIGWLGFKIPNK